MNLIRKVSGFPAHLWSRCITQPRFAQHTPAEPPLPQAAFSKEELAADILAYLNSMQSEDVAVDYPDFPRVIKFIQGNLPQVWTAYEEILTEENLSGCLARGQRCCKLGEMHEDVSIGKVTEEGRIPPRRTCAEDESFVSSVPTTQDNVDMSLVYAFYSAVQTYLPKDCQISDAEVTNAIDQALKHAKRMERDNKSQLKMLLATPESITYIFYAEGGRI
ncbi:MAG: hypothetical protein KKB81_06495 [Candidatus Margulisbacteria bacterium]|nr:hypothetical protein [Candidatus Margulisiibacteriota bacterium]MBU1022445.1 hypothetical protein [Candidatus Margulisiibacteriota bacterium]MBU1728429.1 hypothetical protein [Candidatus Margulisiibacteriota bacterium]MBU1954576.1 hypothetical protein [Candidatus Margulisiibacteriota bacterium]